MRGFNEGFFLKFRIQSQIIEYRMKSLKNLLLKTLYAKQMKILLFFSREYLNRGKASGYSYGIRDEYEGAFVGLNPRHSCSRFRLTPNSPHRSIYKTGGWKFPPATDFQRTLVKLKPPD